MDSKHEGCCIMKPCALTENRPPMIDEDRSDRVPHTDPEQDETPEARYPRELNKRGLLVSLVVSAAVVGLLVISLV